MEKLDRARMWRLAVVALAVASCSLGETSTAPPAATVVFRGGPILTMTDSGTVAALAVRDGNLPRPARTSPGRSWMHNGEDWRSLVDANPGLRIAWHGDDPWVAPISPLHDVGSYVTRADRADDGSLCQPPPWLADNALTVQEALPMMTVNSAYALGLDDTVGSLAAGMAADLIVVTADPTTVAPEALFDLEVVATIVDGDIVYCRTGDQALCG